MPRAIGYMVPQDNDRGCAASPAPWPGGLPPLCVEELGWGEREQKPAHMDLIVPGNIDRYLDLIEEVVCEPEAYGIDAPDLEEAAERILRSLGTDGKAGE